MSMSAIRRYRFLIIAYGLALLAAIWEIAGGIYDEEKAPNEQIRQTEQRHVKDYAKFLQEFYPDSSRAQYYRGIEALIAQPPRLEEARRHFEDALAPGVKTDEQLLYYYAVTLVLQGEDPEKIEEAIADWRWNHPRSTAPDPRVFKTANVPAPAASGPKRYGDHPR